MNVDRTKPVMVTGTTGYVAGWIVKRLLEEGCTVHAAVRSPSDTKKTAALRDVAARHPDKLRFFKADLLSEGSYAAAMAGCGVVFHTASPFATNIHDPKTDLLEPRAPRNEKCARVSESHAVGDARRPDKQLRRDVRRQRRPRKLPRRNAHRGRVEHVIVVGAYAVFRASTSRLTRA